MTAEKQQLKTRKQMEIQTKTNEWGVWDCQNETENIIS